MRPIATVTADVLFYAADTKKWLKPEGSEVTVQSDEGKSNVHLVQESVAGYRIIAERVSDGQRLIDQRIYERLFYKYASPVFHQWKNEAKQVFGLSFENESEASTFYELVTRAISEAAEGAPAGNAGNIYQDPQIYSQQAPHREPDQESVGSGGQLNYRNQQKSSYSSLHNGQAGTLNQQQQQNRRCSQNSNGASSSSNIYAASQQNGHGSNVPQPPPVPVQMNGGQRNGLGVPPAPPPPPNGIASVSTKAPPPPPPPPADFKVAGSNKGTSFADQLKAQQLRKTSGPPSVNGSGTGAGGGNKSNGSDTPSAPQQKQRGGAAELFSELAAKIESRNTTKSCKADTVSTSSSSGVSASDGSDSGATLINNSILGRKLGPNGDASTIRAWNKPNGIVTAGITAAAAQSNGIDSPKVQRKLTEPLSPTITATDLIQFKQEILTEVKQEIAKAKQEILEAIRIQLSR